MKTPSHQLATPKRRRQPRSPLEVVGLTLIAISIILVYAPTFSSPFIFDDERNIKDNIFIRLSSISLVELKKAAFDSPIGHRPVSNLGFALNFFLHKENVVGYHATNVALHLIAAFCLFLLIKVTLATEAFSLDEKDISLIAFLSVLIWAVHPIQTQSVSYIVQRMNSQASLFFILSLLLYAKGRRSHRKGQAAFFLGASVLSGILAVGSKEIAAALPFFILLYEWFFFQNLNAGFLKKRFVYIFAGVLIVVAISFLFLGANPVEKILGTYAHRDFTLPQRLYTQLPVVVFYIGLLLFPHPGRLNLDHDFPLSQSLLHPPTTLGALILIIALVATAVLAAKRHRLLSFGIIWFLGNLVIESSVIGLEIIFEHRLYLPSMFLVVAAVYLLVKKVEPIWLVVGVIGTAGVVCCVWTYQRNLVWADPILFWEDCARKSPQKARPFNNLGTALAHNGQFEDAAKAFRQAIKRDPSQAKPHYNLAMVMVPLGQPDKAIEHLKITLDLAPANYLAHNNLALVYMRLDQYHPAEFHLGMATKIKPDYDSAYNNLGVLNRRKGKLDRAIALFEKAIEINPEYAEAYNNLGYTLKLKGDLKGAIDHFSKALDLAPEYEIAQQNLAETRALGSRAAP